MKHTLYLLFVLVSSVLSLASCRGDPTAPPTSEILPVSVQTRSVIPGEVIPSVRISGGQGNVTIQVTTVGMCATLVDAGVSRAPHELAVVTHVGSNPAALCAAVVEARATDYQGTITSVSEGTYRVRLFEGIADATPRLIGSAIVIVSRPAA
jgi:hypothetical protein